MWFPAIMIDDCDTAIKAEGSNNADSCAFGYFRVRDCGVGLHLNGAGATMFTFRFVLPPGANAVVFKATGGGRIYMAAMKVLSPDTVVPSASNKSRLIVRDCEVADDTLLVDSVNSSNWTENRLKNWVFGGGVEAGVARSG